MQGYGKLTIPAIALGCGVIVKLICNLILVPIPSIGVNGAAIGSVACHLVAFTIVMTALRRNIKLNLTASKFVVKPVIATAIMGICSYFIYESILSSVGMKIATIIAILAAILIYAIAVIVLKIFKKEEILQMPAGNKLYKILEKLKIY